MILIDTSIWIDHFRRGDGEAGRLASRSDVLMHPFVLTEIALGSLPDRALTLRYLGRLIAPVVASQSQVSRLIEENRLFSSGLDFVDVHLLASARLTPDCQLWCRDARLLRVAAAMGLAYTPA